MRDETRCVIRSLFNPSATSNALYSHMHCLITQLTRIQSSVASGRSDSIPEIHSSAMT